MRLVVIGKVDLRASANLPEALSNGHAQQRSGILHSEIDRQNLPATGQACGGKVQSIKRAQRNGRLAVITDPCNLARLPANVLAQWQQQEAPDLR